jgi:hypothetical protein
MKYVWLSLIWIAIMSFAWCLCAANKGEENGKH